VPKPEVKSAYTRFISYISKSDFMPRQVDFFDKRGNQIKRMQLMNIKADGDLLIPMKTSMENLKRGTHTDVLIEEYRVNVSAEELPDSMFTPDFLQSEG
jgi:outer membrane lipoprotein-sorting protein